jgi:hypothetical protein
MKIFTFARKAFAYKKAHGPVVFQWNVLSAGSKVSLFRGRICFADCLSFQHTKNTLSIYF